MTSVSEIKAELRKGLEGVTPGPYQALLCKDTPVNCVDYGVVSRATGKEICRTWTEEDARLQELLTPNNIQALLDSHDRLVEALEEAMGLYHIIEQASKSIHDSTLWDEFPENEVSYADQISGVFKKLNATLKESEQ